MSDEDPRVVSNRRAVHGAALSVLASDGIPGLTVDVLAAASGVSRSTIYRRWPDLPSLVLSAFDEVVHEQARSDRPLPTDVKAALLVYLRDYARRLNDKTYATVLMIITEWAWRDPAFARKYVRTFDQSRSVAKRIVQRGRESGAFGPKLDVDQAVEDIVAPFVYRSMILRRHITDAEVRALHRRLLVRFAP